MLFSYLVIMKLKYLAGKKKYRSYANKYSFKNKRSCLNGHFIYIFRFLLRMLERNAYVRSERHLKVYEKTYFNSNRKDYINVEYTNKSTSIYITIRATYLFNRWYRRHLHFAYVCVYVKCCDIHIHFMYVWDHSK